MKNNHKVFIKTNNVKNIEIMNPELLDILLDGRYDIRYNTYDYAFQKCELTNKETECYKVLIINDFSYIDGNKPWTEFDGWIDTNIMHLLMDCDEDYEIIEE